MIRILIIIKGRKRRELRAVIVKKKKRIIYDILGKTNNRLIMCLRWKEVVTEISFR